MMTSRPYPLSIAADFTVPSAAARMGVPMGAEMSMPVWNSPSPLPWMGSCRWPKLLRIGPITGHSDGASIDRSVPPIPESVPIADTPSMAWVTAPLTAESRRL